MYPHRCYRRAGTYAYDDGRRIFKAKERILNSLADEQESLAKILKFLAVKVEKTAGWLPDSIPNESVNEIVDKVKLLESVIAQELCATASKEQAIRDVISQICHCNLNPKNKTCLCPYNEPKSRHEKKTNKLHNEKHEQKNIHTGTKSQNRARIVEKKQDHSRARR